MSRHHLHLAPSGDWPNSAAQLTCLYLYNSNNSNSSSRDMTDIQATTTGVNRDSSGGFLLPSGRKGQRSEQEGTPGCSLTPLLGHENSVAGWLSAQPLLTCQPQWWSFIIHICGQKCLLRVTPKSFSAFLKLPCVSLRAQQPSEFERQLRSPRSPLPDL